MGCCEGGVWRTIADRDDVHVRITDLPGEAGGGLLAVTETGQAWILLDRALTAEERRAVLCHELVHLDRGSRRADDVPGWVVAREERAVDREATDRLVPPGRLAELVEAHLALEDGGVTVGMVAEWFAVPEWVAQRARSRSDIYRSGVDMSTPRV